MRRSAAVVALVLSAAVPTAAAAAPRVQMMVVGRTKTLVAARAITLKRTTVKIGHRRCAVPAGTALAGLVATHVAVRVTDVAGCDPASMFVRQIGPDANRGLGGWEYKIGTRDPSAGAGDPAGRVRAGQQVLWYWCVRAGDCQRTLSLSIRFLGKIRIARVHVRGYDDTGHARAIAGATVHFGALTFTTNPRGIANVPMTPGRYTVYADKPGLVQSFPTKVAISG
jgi:hypothetical protein